MTTDAMSCALYPTTHLGPHVDERRARPARGPWCHSAAAPPLPSQMTGWRQGAQGAPANDTTAANQARPVLRSVEGAAPAATNAVNMPLPSRRAQRTTNHQEGRPLQQLTSTAVGRRRRRGAARAMAGDGAAAACAGPSRPCAQRSPGGASVNPLPSARLE